MTGVVTSLLSGDPVVGANVSIGFNRTTSDADGKFELKDVVIGSVTINCISAGFTPYSASITLSASGASHDIRMGTQEVWSLGGPLNLAVFVPSGVSQIRGAVLVLGGPDTRGFADGTSPFGAPDPAIDQALSGLADSIKVIARQFGLAILGAEQRGLSSSTASDQFVLAGLASGGAESGHPEMSNIPLLTFGMSGGGPEALGFAHRNPDRTIGVVLRAPAKNHNAVMAPSDATFLNVPVLLITGELDTVVDVPYLRELFAEVRGYGGLWSYTETPGAQHFDVPPQVYDLIRGWTRSILEARLPATSGGALGSIDEAAGWLGDNDSLDTWPWAEFSGDRDAATWLPSAAVAALWRGVVVPP